MGKFITTDVGAVKRAPNRENVVNVAAYQDAFLDQPDIGPSPRQPSREHLDAARRRRRRNEKQRPNGGAVARLRLGRWRGLTGLNHQVPTAPRERKSRRQVSSVRRPSSRPLENCVRARPTPQANAANSPSHQRTNTRDRRVELRATRASYASQQDRGRSRVGHVLARTADVSSPQVRIRRSDIAFCLNLKHRLDRTASNPRGMNGTLFSPREQGAARRPKATTPLELAFERHAMTRGISWPRNSTIR